MQLQEALDLARTLIQSPPRGDLTPWMLDRLNGPDAPRWGLQILDAEILAGCRVNPYTFPQARAALAGAVTPL